eukprot:TRINITY_DN18983_c0_g1_i1.p3 TRINITY_DN18983_c0_g1~~TRINITY_DN18983_c0_g1_i1.p3  ORF type:complete len:154 (-),score=0.83 TRINITY_DN18983_c0_g1_i1:5-424(-)
MDDVASWLACDDQLAALVVRHVAAGGAPLAVFASFVSSVVVGALECLPDLLPDPAARRTFLRLWLPALPPTAASPCHVSVHPPVEASGSGTGGGAGEGSEGKAGADGWSAAEVRRVQGIVARAMAEIPEASRHSLVGRQ